MEMEMGMQMERGMEMGLGMEMETEMEIENVMEMEMEKEMGMEMALEMEMEMEIMDAPPPSPLPRMWLWMYPTPTPPRPSLPLPPHTRLVTLAVCGLHSPMVQHGGGGPTHTPPNPTTHPTLAPSVPTLGGVQVSPSAALELLRRPALGGLAQWCGLLRAMAAITNTTASALRCAERVALLLCHGGTGRATLASSYLRVTGRGTLQPSRLWRFGGPRISAAH
jgi:hypothetical protein